ncbi:MAG: DUF5320 domain-containing protein [Candidatus Pacearchaeota archaeon]
MPLFDGTGPIGEVSLTSRRLGPCGCGLQRGFRFNKRYLCSIYLTKEEEKKILEAELKEIELERQRIEKRLKEIN